MFCFEGKQRPIRCLCSHFQRRPAAGWTWKSPEVEGGTTREAGGARWVQRGNSVLKQLMNDFLFRDKLKTQREKTRSSFLYMLWSAQRNLISLICWWSLESICDSCSHISICYRIHITVIFIQLYRRPAQSLQHVLNGEPVNVFLFSYVEWKWHTQCSFSLKFVLMWQFCFFSVKLVKS